MKSHFLAKHPLIGTKNKPSALYLQERSPYYGWWAYLRRNEKYLACCTKGGLGPLASLYADFGDVRNDDFRAWWGGSLQRGAHLFAEERIEQGLRELERQSDWLPQWPNAEVLVVAVDMHYGRRKLQQLFAKLLQTQHTGKRGRKSMRTAESTARYPLYRNVSQHNLREMLGAYDAWKANEVLPKDQRRPMWAVGQSIKLVVSAMPEKGDTKYITTNKRSVMSVALSRYVRNAKLIIANTALGQFPNSDL